MELMKDEIMRSIDCVPWNMGIEDGYEESIEDFKIVGSSSEDRTDRIERHMEDRVGKLGRSGSYLKLKHKMDVFTFLGTLNLEGLIYGLENQKTTLS